MKINLLASIEKPWFWFYDFKVQASVFLLIAVIILFSWHMVLQQKIDVIVKQGGYLQQELRAMTVKLDESSRPKDKLLINKEKEISSLIENLEQKRTGLVQVFTALHQGMSEGLYLTKVLIKNREVKVIGQTRVMSDLSRLITSLAAAKYGGHPPTIQKITKQDGGYGFFLSIY